MNIYFNGRDDGLGNRLEELIKLDIFCENYNHSLIYRWNNSGKFKYPIIFSSKNIEIVETKERFNKKPFDQTILWRNYVSKNREIFNSENIKFNFGDLQIPKIDLGVHIRAKDRIVENIDDIKKFNGFSTKNELDQIITKSINYINNNFEGQNIFVSSDDQEIKNHFISSLNKEINIYYPLLDSELGEDILDFYILSKANKILMSSHYSTFAITASLIGNKELIGFNDEFSTDLYRFSTKYKNLEEDKIIKKENLNEFLPIKNKEYLNVGGDFKESFLIEQDSLFKTKNLISISNSKYFNFEEHFGLLRNSKVYLFNKNFSYYFYFRSLFEVLRSKENKRINFNSIFNELKRYIELTENNKKIRLANNLNKKIENLLMNKDSIFLKVDLEEIDTELFKELLNKYEKKLTGLVIQTKDLSNKKTIIMKIINSSVLNFCYFSINNEINRNENSAYFVLTKSNNIFNRFSKLPLKNEIPRKSKNERYEIYF
jgi:hypothetical protein